MTDDAPISRKAQLFVGWVSVSVTHAGVGFHASTQPTPILYLIPPTYLVEIQLTPEFQRKLKALAKKYRQIQADLQPLLEQLQAGAFPGDQISGIRSTVMKVRLKNSDRQRGKSGGYRLIYWTVSNKLIVLLDIYSKSDQEDTAVCS